MGLDELREELLDLGFPENVLNDLTARLLQLSGKLPKGAEDNEIGEDEDPAQKAGVVHQSQGAHNQVPHRKSGGAGGGRSQPCFLPRGAEPGPQAQRLDKGHEGQDVGERPHPGQLVDLRLPDGGIEDQAGIADRRLEQSQMRAVEGRLYRLKKRLRKELGGAYCE